MAVGILEVQLVNAKGLRDTDFFGTCFCIPIRIYFSVQSYVYDHVFSLSLFLILSSPFPWYLLFVTYLEGMQYMGKLRGVQD
jgi:hypothetical protein